MPHFMLLMVAALACSTTLEITYARATRQSPRPRPAAPTIIVRLFEGMFVAEALSMLPWRGPAAAGALLVQLAELGFLLLLASIPIAAMHEAADVWLFGQRQPKELPGGFADPDTNTSY